MMDSANVKIEVKPEEGDAIRVNIESIDDESNSGVGDVDLQGGDEASRLRALATDVRDQDDLERDIGRQVSEPGSYLLAENLCDFRQTSYSRSKPMKEIKNGCIKPQVKRSKPLIWASDLFFPIKADTRGPIENFNLRLTNYKKS